MERHRGNSVKCLGFIASKKNHNLKEWKNTPTDGCLSPDQTDRLSLFLSDKQLWPEPWELNLLHQKAQKAIVFLTVQLIKKNNKNPCLKANTMFPLLMLYSSADRKGRVCIPVSQCTLILVKSFSSRLLLETEAQSVFPGIALTQGLNFCSS